MNEFLSLTEIGKLYHGAKRPTASSHEIGSWFENLGLRENGRPTAKAFNEGFVDTRPSRGSGTYFYVWNKQKTTELLDGMCYPRANP